jgi:hypothetical protein
MERTLPTGEAVNELAIATYDCPTDFAMETRSGPTPFAYHFHFSPDGHATRLSATVEADLRSAADVLAPLARIALRRGVEDNLATLKNLLEAGGRTQHTHT